MFVYPGGIMNIKEEWKISNDGKMHLISDGFGRSLELPVSSIGDYGDYF